MEPLSSSVVRTVADYICPLSGPVPPHLLSEPLRQRHVFLGIGPDNPVEYLGWPSERRERVVEMLQRQREIGEELEVCYTVDGEHLFGHVRISPDTRLIFLLDPPTLTWQYHNLDTMPFPPSLHHSFHSAIAAYSPDDFLQEQPYDAPVADNDDTYWDAYGADDSSRNLPSISIKEDDPNSEDAYWAQYSRVHGSGDSTIPSPRPQKKGLDPDATAATATLPERIIVPSDDFQAHHPEPYNPFQAPSPEALSKRLAALSSSSRAASPPLIDDAPTTDSETHTPLHPEISPPPPFDDDHQPSGSPPDRVVPPALPAVATVDNENVTTTDTTTDSLFSPISDPGDHLVQDILKDNIHSLYRLWALNNNRQDTTTVRSPDHHKALFIAMVRQALEDL